MNGRQRVRRVRRGDSRVLGAAYKSERENKANQCWGAETFPRGVSEDAMGGVSCISTNAIG